MNVSTRVREGVLIVDLDGHWPRDQEGWDTLRANIMDVLAPWPGRFALKIYQDEFTSTKIFTMLLGLHSEARRSADERLVVITPSREIRVMIEITRLLTLINVVPTEEEALELPPAKAPTRMPSASNIAVIMVGLLVVVVAMALIRACGP